MGAIPENVHYQSSQAPKRGVDWQNIGFTPYPVNGHIQCVFTSVSGKWSEPRWIPSPYLAIHGLAPGLNYGQQAFEGLRVFRNAAGAIQLFRLKTHAARFARSAAMVGIPPVPADVFGQAVRLAVLLNSEFVPPFDGSCSMYVRPVVLATSATINMQPASEYTLAIMVTPVSTLYSPVGLKAIVVEAFDRTAPHGTGAVKIGGNYGATVPVMQRGREKGFALTLHLDSKTNSLIHEFSASGFVGFKSRQGSDGVSTIRTLVMPKDHQILPSITVDSVATIAESLGWEVERREIPIKELDTLSEVYTVGTASSLVPVSTIVHESACKTYNFPVDPESPDAAHHILNKRLHDIKRGIEPETWGWVEDLDAATVLDDVKVDRSSVGLQVARRD